MRLRMWSYDLAREQCPSRDHLFEIAAMTADAGYKALGLYLEHRFTFPSVPWIHGQGSLSPQTVRDLEAKFPSLQFIPMINLLGHMEGFLYTEWGKQFREEMFRGMQACPSNSEFVVMCRELVADTVACFSSPIIHLGGDEAQQLDKCPACKARVEREGVEGLWGEHFGALARQVLAAGRRPAVWGDMLLSHPRALAYLPKQTLIFDWEYHEGVAETSSVFVREGFEVVACPSLQTFNAPWLHVPESTHNVAQVIEDAWTMGLYGVCLTTWECGLMGAYDTLFPAIESCGQAIQERIRPELSQSEWMRLMGTTLQSAGGPFAYGRRRDSLKSRLLMQSNPFLAWLHHGEELSGECGDKALAICEQALRVAPGEAERGVTIFVRSAVEFVRLAEEARVLYATENAAQAIAKLAIARPLFDELAKVARRTHTRIGGSLADVDRCNKAREHVERVIVRLREYGDGSLGYLPAWEHLTHPKFIAHDQGAWWKINQWADE